MKKASVMALLVASWLLWSGHFDPLMLSFGLVSCVFTYVILGRLEVLDQRAGTGRTLLRSLAYIPWLVWQIILSNISVARILWRRDMQLEPMMESVRSTQQSDLGLVIYANSITLTPGTLGVDAQCGHVLVHALRASSFHGEDFIDMDRRVSALER